MESENLKKLLVILTKALENNDFGKDEQKIQYLCNSFKKIQQKLPTTDEIDEIEKEINYLEIKYDIFNELSYYFDPLYIKIKNEIHAAKVKKIKEENRKKKGVE